MAAEGDPVSRHSVPKLGEQLPDFDIHPGFFRDAVSTDNTLWVVYDDGAGGQPSVVVVKAPAEFPFR